MSGNLKKKGTKQEVFDGLAQCTSGGLKKEDLMLNAKGQVVSKKRSEQGKKQYQNLKKSRPEEKVESNANEPPKEEPKPEANVLAPEEVKFPEPNPEEPKKKVRKYTNKKIKNENPLIDEIQHGDKI